MPKKGISKLHVSILIVTAFLVIVALAVLGAFALDKFHLGKALDHPYADLKLERIPFPTVTGTAREAFDITYLHPKAGIEWWYVNTHLIDEKGKRLTLMMTLLKPSSIYGLLAKVDEQLAIPIFFREPLKLVRENRTYGTGSFRMTQPDPKYFCYNLLAERPAYTINLNYCANKPPLAVGGKGRIKMGRSGQSFYYSLTNMNVAGTITTHTDGKVFKVRGKGWLDRQWGNWENEDFDKWQWFSIQLHNGMEIMFFNFISAGRSVSPIGEIVNADGSQEHNLHFRMKTVNNWVSPKTKISWPSGWEIEILRKDIKLFITPDMPDQEVNEALWEGGCSVRAIVNGEEVQGRAFYEERRKTWEDRRRELFKQGVFY